MRCDGSKCHPWHIVKVAELISDEENRFDERMQEADPKFIDDMSGKHVKGEKNNDEKENPGMVSFLSKYCSFHDQEHTQYPICDTRAKEMLQFINKKISLYKRGTNLECYCEFKNAIDSLIEKVGIKDKNYRKVDAFLWMSGHIRQSVDDYRKKYYKKLNDKDISPINEVNWDSYQDIYKYGCKNGFKL